MIETAENTEVKDEIKRIFNLQQANRLKISQTTAKERIEKLKKLHQLVLKNQESIKKAIYQDFRKPDSEVDLTEIYPVTSEIKHAVSHLKKWMKLKKVSTPMVFAGAKSYIQYEPKGVVLIIAPWNFPFNLVFGPLVSAIAAGNCVMIKPSEMTPHASALTKKMIEEIFPENEVAIFEGDYKVSEELLKLPFNHIFFTGSPQVGKIVMKAAAENLASVTLELGGKSPVIIDETADVEESAEKVAWTKLMNNGQICIAPDYVLVHESKHDGFIEAFKKVVGKFYGNSPEDIKASPDYARIVNHRHYQRVKGLIEDARNKGAKIELGANFDDGMDFISPTLISNVPENAKVMEEEIFGPVLPVLPYSQMQDPLNYVNSRPIPLAMYIFSKKKKNVKKILNETTAGGTCINDCGIHFYNNNIPFGGSNNSGVGKSHGFFGFEAFSNARSVMKQPFKKNATHLLVPPYNVKFKQKMREWTIKYL
ncbi:aldehyde dehydrogenase family protein [Flexithrix dorotheae]|uniref:aldehyde dehydrogenase family protein n=1 Tax=Flexithrix dorotheae TaxID=70993 RepID=UPI000368C5BA|nr:aldehyde dehydrogenase family protein [Flexithrix dorotheae]